MAHTRLFEHVKLRNLCALLGLPRPHAVGHLECLAYYTATRAIDGDLSNLTDREIELAAEWIGPNCKPGAFLGACLEARFIDRDADGATRVHDWEDWCPDWVKKRLERLRSSGQLQSRAASNGKRHLNGDGQRQPVAADGCRTADSGSRAAADGPPQSQSQSQSQSQQCQRLLQDMHPPSAEDVHADAIPSPDGTSGDPGGPGAPEEEPRQDSCTADAADADTEPLTSRRRSRAASRRAAALRKLLNNAETTLDDWPELPARYQGELIGAAAGCDQSMRHAMGMRCQAGPDAARVMLAVYLRMAERAAPPSNPGAWMRKALESAGVCL